MHSKVHPLIVALVLLLTGIALAVWMWGGGEAARVGGPAELRLDSDGHFYIQIQNQLVEHDANGDFLKTHDLTELGVELFLGTYGFFSDGDILLRRGPDPRSFGDNFRAYQRKTNEQSIKPETSESGLFRCDLDTKICTRFGQAGVDFKAAHGIFIDWQTDDVYISDTTRHALRKYADDGTELAGPVTGFKFPNQLLIDNEQLLVADTNHHQIRIVDSRTAKFGDDIEKTYVVPNDAHVAGQTWPSHFVRVGSEWWVNNMRTGMNEGGIYVFDDEWQYDRKVALPPDADPISLVALGGEVLISDWNNDRIHRVSASGEQLPDFESAGLERILEDSRATRGQFEMIAYSGITLLALVIGGLMVRALVVTISPDTTNTTADKEAQEPVTSDMPLSLEPDAKVISRMSRIVQLAAALAVVASVMVGYLITTQVNIEFGIRMLWPAGAMVAMIVLISWVNRANVGTAINLHSGRLTLRDHQGRESSCPVKDVRYDQTAIATHELAVFLGRPMAAIYNQKVLEEELFPRLGGAQKVSALQMQQILIQKRHPQGLITIIAVFGLIVYAAWRLAT